LAHTPVKAIAAMTNRPVLERAIPVFGVEDIAAAVTFYCSVLGFTEGWSRGSPPTLVQVARDDIEVHLARGAGSGATSAYFHVKGVDAYYAEVRARGGKVVDVVGDRASGMRDFVVTDPAGNMLSFGEPVQK